MNNFYFSSLLCITVLALAPACNKKKSKPSLQKEVRTTIELSDTIFEIEAEVEEDLSDQKIIKF